MGRFIGKPEGGGRRLHEGSRCLGSGMQYFIQMERRGNALIQLCKTLQTGKTMFQALQVLLMVQHCARLSMDRMQFLDALLYSLLVLSIPRPPTSEPQRVHKTFLTILCPLNKIF